MKIKNLLVNKPAFHLSEQNYFRYIVLLSRVLQLFGTTYSLRSRKLNSTAFSNVKIWEIRGIERPILIQSQYRISRFLKGFTYAGMRQWNRYGISDLLKFELPDVLIDIGANIGEVSFYGWIIGIKRIISVDPDPIAFECLEFNLSGTSAELDCRALGESSGDVTFYSKAHSADSSLFKPEGESIKVQVEAITLKRFFEDNSITGNILLKMDAEGFEPEILRSGISELHKIKWVAIDSGAERGNETTVDEVVAILKEANFNYINVSIENIVTASRC